MKLLGDDIEALKRVGEQLHALVAGVPGAEDVEMEQVGGLPMTFIVDAQGRTRFHAFGDLDWSSGEPLKLVEKLAAEAPRAGR